MTEPDTSRGAELTPADAEVVLLDLAAAFIGGPAGSRGENGSVSADQLAGASTLHEELPTPSTETMYRALVEQIPAVVFMAYIERGIGEAYVSPQIEEALGFTREEWLEDPVRWYHAIHPADRGRWSVDAAHMLMSGEPLRAAYRVLARDGRVIWFQCEAKMIRRENGRPWFIHGIGFDITERKTAEEQLLASLREKEAMLKEIHHRVKNNLAVVSSLFYLQSTYTSDAPTRKILQESQDRVRSMALVHEILYGSEDLGIVDFGTYAAGLAQQLIRTYSLGEGSVKLRTELAPVRLSVDRAIPCGLILNEMMTNALKHAFPGGGRGTVHLVLRDKPGECLLEVSDDGVGPPPGLDFEKAQSFGLRLIRTLSRQLDGDFQLVSAVGGGATARLTFPNEYGA